MRRLLVVVVALAILLENVESFHANSPLTQHMAHRSHVCLASPSLSTDSANIRSRRTFVERQFGSLPPLPDELPTRQLEVPSMKRFTNAALASSEQTLLLLLLAFAFNFMAFPLVASTIVPLAFSNDVLEILGRGLAMELDSSSNLVGRPVADTVLTSVVMPATGILFATLSSTTLGTLRTRQQQLRTSFRQECIAFETLLQPLRKLFIDSPHQYSRVLCLMLQYSEDAMADACPLTDRELKSERFDAERAGMLGVLAVIGEVDYTLMDERQPLQRTLILSRVVGYAQSLCVQMNNVRATRRSAFLSTYPTIHWVLLGALGATIPTLFVVLASTYKGTTVALLSEGLIRALFAVLATSISGYFVLLADLNDPFAGSHSVNPEQFETGRQQIYAALDALAAEHPELRAEHRRLARLSVTSPGAVVAARPPAQLSSQAPGQVTIPPYEVVKPPP